MRSYLYGAFWIGIYLVLIMAPLFVLLVGPARQDVDTGESFVTRKCSSKYTIACIPSFNQLC
jgi:hypothetical protein